MQCPVCGERMREVVKLGVEIDICPGCKGVWLDRGELEKMVGMENQEMSQRSEFDREFGKPQPQPDQQQMRSEYQGDRYYDQHREYDRDDDRRYDDHKRGKYDKHGHYPRKRKSVLGEILGEIFD